MQKKKCDSMYMHGTIIEKEAEICATNLANKKKCMSTNAKKWKKFLKIADSNTKKKNTMLNINKHRNIKQNYKSLLNTYLITFIIVLRCTVSVF
jgi:hypothetical protein